MGWGRSGDIGWGRSGDMGWGRSGDMGWVRSGDVGWGRSGDMGWGWLAPPLSPEPWSGASPRWGAAKQPLQPRLQVAHSGGQPMVMRPPPRSWQPPLSPTRGLVRQPSQSPTRLASISPTRVAVTRSVSQSPPSAPMQALAPELASGVSVLIGGCRCLITEPLGMGSFGVVWAAKCDLPAGSVCSSSLHEVAVKEIRCRSEVELSRA
ncbi:unnamed protein product, partial [Polarella glacialis]